MRFALLAALAALATAQPRLPGLGNPGCVPLARTLHDGACSPVSAALQPVMGSLAAASCADLAAHPAQAAITPACCADARAFVAAGCACDPAVNTFLAAAGVPAGALAGGVRLAQASICGPLATPTCKDIVACPAPAGGR